MAPSVRGNPFGSLGGSPPEVTSRSSNLVSGRALVREMGWWHVERWQGKGGGRLGWDASFGRKANVGPFEQVEHTEEGWEVE